MPEALVVDARGLACPMPVVRAKKAIESAAAGTEIRVMVDNENARDNVSRMAETAGCRVAVEGVAPAFIIRITVGAAVSREEQPVACCTPSGAKPVVVAFVNKDVMGHGDETLGRILIKAFFQTLKDLSPRPDKILFVNGGVHLACEGSPLLSVLQDLAGSGVKVISCGTCLDFFRKLDKVRVGTVSNMYEILTQVANADRVLAP